MIRSLAPSAAMSAADPEHSLHRNSVSAVVETAMMKESPRGLGASPREACSITTHAEFSLRCGLNNNDV